MIVQLRQWLVNAIATLLNRGANGWQLAADQAYGHDRLQNLDVYGPVDARKAPVVVLVHGGSWQHASKDQISFAAAALAKAGYIVASIEYRIYPAVRYPSFVEDAATATRWVHDHIAEFGGDPTRLVLMGHSSGAHTVAMLGVNPQFLNAAGVPLSTISGVIGLAGPYDFNAGPSFQPIFKGTSPEEYLPARVAKRQGTQLPFLLLHGKLDTVVGYSNSLSLAEAIRQHGGDVRLVPGRIAEHMLIIGALRPKLRWTAPTYKEVIAFIDRVTK